MPIDGVLTLKWQKPSMAISIANQNGNRFDDSSLINELNAEELIPDLFAGLKSQYSQINFFKTNFGLIMPLTVNLPAIPQDFGRHKTRSRQSFKQQNYVCVPLIDQLEQLLNIEDIYHEIMEKPVVSHGSGCFCRYSIMKIILTKLMKNILLCYFRYEGDSNFKSSHLFKRHPRGLQIILNIDEVQMCNPIGSYSHKVVYVYFSLGNIPFKFRSRLQLIHLLSIFYFEQTAFYNLNTMLRPIIEELKRLEEGVEIQVKGTKTTIFGTLIAVVAENLASHQIGGFKSGFSKGFRKCRTCLGIDHEIQNYFSDSQIENFVLNKAFTRHSKTGQCHFNSS